MPRCAVPRCAVQVLLRDVQSRLEAAVEATSLPAWPPLALAASHRAECYLCHRFGRALRLLQNICAFEGALPRSALQVCGLVGGWSYTVHVVHEIATLVSSLSAA